MAYARTKRPGLWTFAVIGLLLITVLAHSGPGVHARGPAICCASMVGSADRLLPDATIPAPPLMLFSLHALGGSRTTTRFSGSAQCPLPSVLVSLLI